MKPPLAQFPVAQSSCQGRLRDAVGEVTGYDHQVLRSANAAGHVPGVVNGARFGAVSLVFVAYAMRVRVWAPAARDQLMLVLPLGPMRVRDRLADRVVQRPFVIPANAEIEMEPDPGAGALVGAIAVDQLEQEYCRLFGEYGDVALQLPDHGVFEVEVGFGLRREWESFARNARPFAAQEVAERRTLAVDALPVETEETPLLDALLSAIAPLARHHADPLLDATSPKPYVIETLRRMRRELADEVSVASLADRVGVSIRQLQLEFRAQLGCTPQQALLGMRLERARVMLKERPPGMTVAQIGAAVGIAHQGRFAQYYAARYGASPSVMLG